MMLRLAAMLGLMPLCVFASASVRAETHSFDCRKASAPIDFVFCSDAILESANDALAKEWLSLRSGLDASGREDLIVDQAEWMRTLTESCGLPPRGKPLPPEIAQARNCVLAGTQDRISRLRGWKPDPAETRIEASCEDENAHLSPEEIARIRKAAAGTSEDVASLMGEDGSVLFVCRSHRNPEPDLLWRTPDLCSACGEIYSLIRGNGKDTLELASPNGMGSDTAGDEDIVYDKSGRPFVLIGKSHISQGLIYADIELIGITGGPALILGSIQSYYNGCEDDGNGHIPDEDHTFDGPRKLPRTDGLVDLEVEVSRKACKTGKISSEIVRYVPTRQGFKKK